MLAVLAITSMLVVQGVAPAAYAKTTKRRLADGVRLITIKQRKPRLHVRIVRIAPRARVNVRPVLAQGKLPGHEPTSSMARRKSALVAVNGDYAEPSGRPVMTFARGGRLAQSPLTWGRNFTVARDRRTSHIGPPKLRVELMPEDAEEPIKIARVNNGKPTDRQLTVHTKAGGKLERPPERNSCQARLKPSAGPRVSGFGLEIGFTVGQVRCGRGSMHPREGAIVSARRNTFVSPLVKSLVSGTSATLRWSLAWDRAYETVGGNPTLVEDGRIVVQRSSHPFFQKHPRTGVGLTGNDSLLLITVDGRWRKSRGIKLRRFARLFKDHGAKWALNLDGGGSTTMVVKGKIVNRPSDRRERPVSSALVVVKGGATTARVASRQSDPSPARVWEEAVADPASTGGMAAALVTERRTVPDSLRRAARGFYEAARLQRTGAER